VQVTAEAVVPSAFVRVEIAAEHALSARYIEGAYFSLPACDDLADEAGVYVADVDGEGEGGVGADVPGQVGPRASEDPEGVIFPEIPGGPDGGSTGRDAGGQRLSEGDACSTSGTRLTGLTWWFTPQLRTG
jgi:hypothetical protein